MKKFLLTLILLAFVAHADDSKGIRANVELVSGTKQTVQFLGISQDTVSLGGTIQGKFTIIKIAKNRFKSIVDENGNDLLNTTVQAAAADNVDSTTVQETSVPDSIVQDSATIASDSTAIASDSTAQDSSVQVVAAPTVTNEFLNSVDSKHIFVALERRSIDSALAEQLNNLTMRMLQESGIPTVFAKRTDFGYCREAACIKDSLKHYGASDLYLGSIIAAKSADSVTVQLVHHDLRDTSSKPSTAAIMNLSTMKALSDAMSGNKLKNFITQVLGIELPQPKEKKSYIHVETNPEGATLATDSQGEICRTPCTFVSQDSGKVILYAYWNVDKQLWGARHAIVPVPFDTTKISLKLKPMRPELRVMTIPSNAEIYAGSGLVTVKSKPIGHTPDKFPIFEPGMTTVQLRKEGFRDTTITTFVPPSDLTDLSIELQPITDIEELHEQEAWLKQRKIHKIGQILMGSSLGPVLIGGLFAYMASQDYSDAEKIKKELNLPVSSGGEHYREKIQENHNLVSKGKRKTIIGGTLLGVGAAMLTAGFVLSF